MQTDLNNVLPAEACRKPDATAAAGNRQQNRVAFEPVRWPDGFCLSVRVCFDWALKGWKDLARVCKSRVAGGNQRHRQEMGYASRTHFGQSGPINVRKGTRCVPYLALMIFGVELLTFSGYLKAGEDVISPIDILSIYLRKLESEGDYSGPWEYVLARDLQRLLEDEAHKPLRQSFSAQNASTTYHGAYQNDNSTYTTEPGEPLPAGMNKTAWRLYKPTRDEHIVFNTFGSNRFGSELDTVLAVYSIEKSKRAKGFQLLKAVADNDNLDVPGQYSSNSLVQFDAVKGKIYAIQVGSKGQGGDVLLTAFSFPPEGGLTIQPFSVYDGYSYDCNLVVNYEFYHCDNASYIVHNSTAKTLTVTASTSFGNGFDVPEPFTLAPGAAVVKTFTYNNAFDKSTVKTLSGGFTLTGTAEDIEVARISMPARISVHALLVEEPKLELKSQARVLSGATGAVFTFPVEIKNSGNVPASGCYVTNGLNESTLQAAWAAYDPATKQTSGEANAPFDIPLGETVHILVGMRSFTDRLADPADYQSPVEIGCASASNYPNPGLFDLTNNVDFTTTVTQYPHLTLVKTMPETPVLNVSAPGKVFMATFKNNSKKTAKVTAVLEEQAYNEQTGEAEPFGVSVCTAKTKDAKCLASSNQKLALSIKKGKTVTIKVAVRYPQGRREFSAHQGVSLLLMHDYDNTGRIPAYIPLTGTTKALLQVP